MASSQDLVDLQRIPHKLGKVFCISSTRFCKNNAFIFSSRCVYILYLFLMLLKRIIRQKCNGKYTCIKVRWLLCKKIFFIIFVKTFYLYIFPKLLHCYVPSIKGILAVEKADANFWNNNSFWWWLFLFCLFFSMFEDSGFDFSTDEIDILEATILIQVLPTQKLWKTSHWDEGS